MPEPQPASYSKRNQKPVSLIDVLWSEVSDQEFAQTIRVDEMLECLGLGTVKQAFA